LAGTKKTMNIALLLLVCNLLKAGLKSKTSDRHVASIAAYQNVEDALIKVERIDSPILVLSGGSDEMWPANEMAVNICERANLNKKVANCSISSLLAILIAYY